MYIIIINYKKKLNHRNKIHYSNFTNEFFKSQNFNLTHFHHNKKMMSKYCDYLGEVLQ